jgi:uncharacterized protein (TIGR03663 family)
VSTSTQSNTSRGFIAKTITISTLAFILRLLFLDVKPPHFDEGINGFFLDQMRATGTFLYDPQNYHGPLHFYLLFFFQSLFGNNLIAIRLAPSIAGALSTLATIQFHPFIGRKSALISALLVAISPGLTFYSRYGIHEAELFLFTILTLLGLVGLLKTGKPPYLWILFAGLSGSILTKETYIIHLAGIVGAAAPIALLHLFRKRPIPIAPQLWTPADLLNAIFWSTLFIITIYTCLFTHLKPLAGLLQTFLFWTKTGTSPNGQAKPFLYWIQLASLYEWPAVIGLLTAPFFIILKTRLLFKWLALYTIFIWLAYSIIPYKTPWCIMHLLFPTLLLVGIAYQSTANSRTISTVAAISLIAATCHSAYKAIHLNFLRYAEPDEPYVYVQETTDYRTMTNTIKRKIHADPSSMNMTGYVTLDPFPMIWDLQLTNVLYTRNKPSESIQPSFALIAGHQKEIFETYLKGTYHIQKLNLRSANPAYLYLNTNIFDPETTIPPTTFSLKPHASP